MLNYEKSMKIPEKKCQKHEDTQNFQKTMKKMPSDHAQPPSYDQISVTMIKSVIWLSAQSAIVFSFSQFLLPAAICPIALIHISH